MAKNQPLKNTVLDALTEFHVEVTQKELKQMEKRLVSKKEIKRVKIQIEKGFAEAAADRKEIKRQINELKTDTPTQKEFDELKTKVNQYHPAN